MTSPGLKNSLENAACHDDQPNSLDGDLRELLGMAAFADLTFLVGEKQTMFRAHSFIFVARCSAFSAPPEGESVCLPHISARAFKVFLEFLYTDVLRHMDDDGDLYALARLYQVGSLIQYRSSLLKGRSGPQALGGFSLSKDLSRLFESGTAADVTLRTEDDEEFVFRGHKALLAARSIFFSSLFCGNWKETAEGVVTIRDTSLGVLQRVLQFIYTDELQPSAVDEALELISAAHFFGLEAMRPACEAFFATPAVITPDNVVDLWHFALDEGMNDAAKSCCDYMATQFYACTQRSSFLKLRRNLLKSLLQAGHIDEQTSTVLEAVLRWARVHTPAGEDPVTAVADLLPPQTLFNSTNKRVMLGMRATLFI